jgi:hypothetical protein
LSENFTIIVVKCFNHAPLIIFLFASKVKVKNENVGGRTLNSPGNAFPKLDPPLPISDVLFI